MVVYTQADGNKLNNVATPSCIDTMHTEVYTETYKRGKIYPKKKTKFQILFLF